MSDQPLVSIVIPCYRSATTVGATISGALTQTYPRVEVIVVDDGSDDGSAAVLAGYGQAITVVTQANAGVSAARNAGIERANGELVAIVDADDVILPAYIDKAVQAWQDAGPGKWFVTCEAYVLGADGIFPRRRVLPLGAVPAQRQRMTMIERNAVNIMSVFPVQMWRELGGFTTGMHHGEDYDFWARAVFAGWQIAFQLDPQAFYRRAEGTASRAAEKMHEGQQIMRRRLLSDYGSSMSAAERAQLEFALAHGSCDEHISAGEQALARGDRSGARAQFALAARLSPTDRRIRLKAKLLALPGGARVLSSLQDRRLRETGA